MSKDKIIAILKSAKFIAAAAAAALLAAVSCLDEILKFLGQ